MSELVNVHAERSVLGGIMLQPSVVWEVLEQLRPGDFADPALATVYEAIIELAQENVPLDAITVGDRLQRTGRLNARVTLVLVHELTSEVPTGANAPHYAGIVRDLAKRRRLADAAQAILGLPGAEGDAAALVERARELVDEVSSTTVRAPHRVGSTLDALVDDLNERPTFARTPWDALDRYLGGFRPGGLYVVAARPGVGKTVVALQVARALAKAGPVGFVSLEMPEGEIQKRLLSSVGEVGMEALVNQQLTAGDWQRLALARQELVDLQLYVKDDVDTPMQVVSFARTLHRMGRMQALVVDYLQLLSPDVRGENRELELSTMTRTFKKLAQRLGIPVILLSQLNRQGAQRKGKEALPQLTDLRGSGAIEQDADVVLLLHREAPKGAELKVYVAKNRHGKQGELALLWEGQFARAVTKQWSHVALLDNEEKE